MQLTANGKTYPSKTGRLPNLSIKTLLIMKFTAILLFAACLQVSARSSAQAITLKEKNAPLEKVFKAIEKQSGYVFFFNYQWLAQSKPVTVELKDIPLAQALDECFKDQPFHYAIVNKTIVVKQKEEFPKNAEAAPAAIPPPNIDVTVTVLTADGQPLEGASVVIKGNNKGIATDINGRATLKMVDANAIVIVSFTGYLNQEIKINNRSSIGVRLAVSTSELDQVQIIAYGQTSKRLQTGNVSTVTGEDIAKQPVGNPLLALQGRIPGLFITQTNGLSGGGVIVRVQGQNSINGGNDPLYVIDGVPYSSQMLITTTGGNRGILGKSGASELYAPGGNGNPMSYINPADIESIDVLKDADATAIYGSRAANGAILITTKKGKAGQTKVDINMQQGWGKVSRSVNMMNTQQYLEMRHEAFKNNGTTPGPSDYDVNGLWDTTRYTDWRKVLIGGSAQYTNINASISGGTGNTQYLLGGTYHRETTVFPGSFADKKGSLHFNLNSVSTNQKFRLQLSSFYLVDNNQLPQLDLTANSYGLAPNAPALYNADGTLNWAPNAAGNSSWTNPLNTNLNIYQSKTKNLISNALLSYRIFPGLEIRSSFGYNNLQTNEFAPDFLTSIAPESRPNSLRDASYTYSTINTWVIEPQANYKRIIWKGKLDVLIGTTFQKNNSDGLLLTGIGYNDDAVVGDIHQATSVSVNNTVKSAYKYNALFGRLNYNLQDKYIVDFTARRDGSSRFGPKSQFHNFGSAGAAWIFSQEKIVKSNISFLSFGKLKASYGTTGNDQIGDYAFMNLYSPTSGVAVPYQGATGLSVSGLPNPYLQWEETKKLQFGIDFGFLNDRILFNATYARNRSSNQLLSYALPIITGNSGILENFPATVQNTSLEFLLNTTNLKTQNFIWSSNLNLTIPKNKLVAFPSLATSTYASSLIIGQPVTIIKAYHFMDVNSSTGIYQFAGSNGIPTSSPNPSTDRTVLINTLPKFYGGFQNSFTYKGFQLDMLFQFVKQIGAPGFLFGFNSYPSKFNNNQPTFLLSRWQKPGDITSVEKFLPIGLFSPYVNANSSDAFYEDASYIRLKNLSLSYELPGKWKQKTHLQNCRIYVQGQNLLTITKFRGLDPETQNFSLPPLRVFTFGLQAGL